ncbi:putative Ig domain-containing protein [Rhodanobacter sp. KK11]|uniref:putative Ig domain-containing protein n=1 Tax=Rhodanobacter sp. KK11 TaxID=3083255 RepID=UPI0029672600|nr:putative Ig domain-containing protein [Rhodanobacter sp. KK11]MDW2981789.1 putative Ig domain-containing protein [Rhodanobacter sp. KK11]
MVAVISGNGLGLLGTSASALGPDSRGGLGQSGASQYVNVATGNLVLQDRDEQLVAQGLLAGLTRTYNSLGSTGDVGAGAWLLGLDRRLGSLTGTLGTAGSTISRDGGDGEEELFTYDAARGLYAGTTKAGAEDTLVWSAGSATWTYTGGGSRQQETYSAAGALTDLTDGKSGAHYHLGYDSVTQQLASVTADDGEALLLGYADGRLGSLSTVEIPAGGGAAVTRQRVTYGYDTLGRLQSVTTDLTPDNAGDAQAFTTTYAYDGDSLRLASLTQSDGVAVQYTYAQDGQGAYRVASVTTGSGAAAQTLSFGYDLASRTTTVTDAGGRAWTYGYDAAGNLTAVTSPAVNGQRQVTSYTYTAEGYPASMTDALGQTTLYRYDAHGNRILERDAAGDTVNYTYNADDQLLTRTVYRRADPDGTDAADAGAPADPATTRYVYDGSDRLRFVIAADGGVQETQYDAQGRVSLTRSFAKAAFDTSGLAADAAPDLATMTGWAGTQDLTRTTRTDYGYDTAGRLSQRIDWDQVDGSGNGVADVGEAITRYVYDGQGLLRQQVTVRGSARTTLDSVAYAYDGLGRLLSRTDNVAASVTSYAYQDAQGTVAVAYANGLVHTEVRNSAGEVVAVTESASGESTRTTHYVYDAEGQLRAVQDAGGGVSYTFYDAAGRVAGTVDDTGAVTRYVRDADGQVVETVQYAARVDTTTWLSGGAVVPTDLAAVLPASGPSDRVTLSLWDAAGRHAADVDALGAVTVYRYDGTGHRVSTTAYATSLSAAALAALQAAPSLATLLADVVPGAQDRTAYTFYDLAGRPVATLDAAGGVTTTTYDAAGRVVKTVAYATALSAAQRSALGASPSLAAVLAAVTPGQGDQVTRAYYDNRGQLVAAVDAAGYLTTTAYDEASDSTTTSRYGQALTADQLGALTGQESVAALVADVAGSPAQTQVTAYDAEGRVHQVTAADGAVTVYAYDSVGHLLSTTTTPPNGGQVRSASATYDAFGEVRTATDGAQAVTTHAYDARGRETLRTDALGNKLWSYYDAAGRLAYTVAGQPSGGTLNAWGEITAYTYNAFGQVASRRQLAGRATLTGGSSSGSTLNPGTAALADLATASAVLANPSKDALATYLYTLDGQVASVVDGAGYQVAYQYDAFGEVVQQQRQLSQPGQALGAGNSTITRYGYDSRGERISETDDVGGLNRTSEVAYDVFGRVASQTDAQGSTTTYTYDRLGRQVTRSQSVQGTVRTTEATYDAYGRVLTQTDAMGQVTAYGYAPDTHTVQVTTPDGVTVTTVTDAYGDTLSVTDGAGDVTRYTYDGDGRLLQRTDALGQASTNQYDADGYLLKATDATGHGVTYTYDASGRVLTRTVDPSGLNLVTTYTYDGRGQVVSVTGPGGEVTTYAYDADGHVLTMVEDAGSGHLNLTTVYAWDGAGEELSVTEGAGTAGARTTSYAYDNLGRRIRTVVDPGSGHLNLTTAYAYDGNDHLVGLTDPNGNLTRYVYDEAGEQVFTIDPAGGVTQAGFDADGRIVTTRRYTTALDATALAALGAAPTVAQVAAAVTPAGTDPVSYSVYDAAGRLHYTLDPRGFVTERRYDSAGRLAETLAYASAVSPQAISTANLGGPLAQGTADAGMASLVAAAGNTEANAHATLNLYDTDGQVRFVVQQNTINGQRVAQVSERRYDAAGRVLSEIAYGTTIPLSTSALTTQLSTSSVAQTLAGSTNLHTSRYVYDAAGRLRYTIDAGRYVTEQQYDAEGRVAKVLTYLNAIAVPGALTEATVASAVAAANTAGSTRYTQNTYDLAGRLTRVADALGTRASSTYDATGLKLTETNRDGAVWTYQYDAAGRQTRQISPPITVATYTSGNTLGTATASVVTALAYDANGNVISRTDAYGTAAARTLTYAYDSRNHQTTTTYPDAGYVNPGNNIYQAASPTGATTAVVTYDALGRAVVSKDVRGHYAYKTYDLDGEVAYEVDANGYVTAHAYDAYGNETAVTRYATALNTAAISGWSAGQALSVVQVQQGLATSDSDRTITTAYDQANRKTSVALSSISYAFGTGPYAGSWSNGSPTTTYAYDAYGNVVSTAVLLQGAHSTLGQPDYAAPVWATTYSYYDARNAKVMDVDPMGYVTTWAYNGAGQVASTTEYANAIATGGLTTATPPGLPAAATVASGYDRTTSYTYDGIGRKTQQVQGGDFSYVNGTAGIAAGSSVTGFGYDGEDRVTSVTVNGATTSTTYDALGRVLSVTEPVRAVLASTWQATLAGSASVDLSTASLYVQAAPVTTLTYDALGNAVRTVRTGAGVAAQTTYDHYDALGRQVAEFDANGHPTYSAYDAAGNLTGSWYTLSGNTVSTVVTTTSTYDAANQRLSTVTTRAGAGTPDRAEYVKYNAFGEVAARGDGVINAYSSTGYEIGYTYDNAGNLRMATDAGTGSLHSYARDLVGNGLGDTHTVTGGGSSVWTSWVVDLDGRRKYQSQPSESAATGESSAYLTFTYDRWGNVLSETDARGYVTTFVYDSRNHVIKTTEPQVLVVGADGSRTWQMPVKQWYYDVNGRLMGVTDENNHASWNTYDAAGQLTIRQDALGAKTYTAYDTLGRALVQQTPPVQTSTGTVAHITTTTYDADDQVTAQGDFTLDASGATRTAHALRTYTLNENGDRRQVADALNNTAYYDYDSQHRVLKSQTAVQHASNVADTVSYDANGNKIGETDANGNAQSWVYDYFGRVRAHTDLSGASYGYTYDAYSGLLTRQTSTWAPAGQANPGYIPGTWVGTTSEVDYAYYANGLVQQKTEKTGSQTSAWTTYQYDASGNATDVATYTTDGAGQVVHNETVTRYDSHNRLSVVTNQNPDTHVGLMRTAYNYDAAGNRRAVFVQSGFGTNASPINTGTGGPTVATIAAQTAPPSQPWSFNAASAFTDTLGFGLSFTGANLPAWMHLSADGVLSGNPLANGSWTVTLTATDVTGATVSTTLAVTVPLVNPVFGGGLTPPTGKIGTALSFTAPAATDANGAAITYTAQYSNGSAWVALPSWLSFNATTRVFSGTPPAGSIGSYSLRVLASAANGGSAALGFTFTVASTPPVYQGGLAAQTADATRAFSYTVPASAFYENDQTALTYAATGLPSWLTFNASTHVFSGTPPTTAIGTSSTLTVTVTNPQGQSAAGAFTVGVEAYVQPAPVYNGGYTNQAGVIGGSAITIAKPANAFTEPDGGALTYTAMVLIPQHQLTTLNGDMVTTEAQPSGMATPMLLPPGDTITVPAQWVAISQVGLGINATTGAITGVPTTLNYLVSEVTDTYQKDTSYQLEVIATNGQGGTAAAQFTLANSYAPPAVQNAIATPAAVNPNAGAILLVQANTFTDPYGAGLAYGAKLSSGAALPAGMSWSGSSLTVGQLASGNYTLTITATDGLGRTASANVTVTVNNVGPVFSGGVVNQSAATSVAMTAYLAPAATDANGDAITYSATGMPTGVTFNASTRTFSGTPTAAGNFTVTYKATDSKGAVTSVTFQMAVAGPPALLNAIANPPAKNPNTAAFTVVQSNTFSDPWGHGLTYSATMADGTALNSGLVWSGTSLSIGQIASGSYAIKVIAKDAVNRTVSTTFTLVVNNVAPVLTAPANQSGTTSIAITSFQGPAASDANGDAITYSATGLPPGIAFNAGTRTFSGTPTTAGTYTVSYTATDSKGASSTRTFTMTIVAATLPPVYHGGYTNVTGTIGKPLSIPMPAGAFTSPGGQALTYTAKVLIPQHQLTTLNGDMIVAKTQPSDTVTPMMLPPGDVITVPAQWVAISQVGLSIGANGTISGTPTTLDYLIDEVTDTYQHDRSYQLEVIATNAYGSATAQFTLSNSAAGTSSLTVSTSSAGTASPAGAHGVGPGDPGADPALPANAHGAAAGGSGANPALPVNAQGAAAGQGHPAGGTDTGGEVTPNLLPLPDPDDPPPSGGGGTSTPPVPNIQSYWFTYDADNRVDIVNGQLSNGHVTLKASAASYELSYDAAGNTRARTTVSASSGDTLVQSSYYDERNELVRADYSVDLTTGGASRGVEETRSYDAAGRLSVTAQFYANGTTVGGSNMPYYKRDPDLEEEGYYDGTDVSGMLASATAEHYDASGQLLQEQNFGHAAGWDGTGASSAVPAAPALDATSWGGLALQNEVTYKTAVGAAGTGYDAVGNVVGYQYYDLAAARTDTYTVNYLKKDGYLERATSGSSSNGNYVPATDTSYYDNLGERIAIDQHVQLPSGTVADTVRAFAFDGSGQILQRRDGTLSGSAFVAQGGAGTDHYAYVAGQQVGSVDEAGGIDALDGLTAFSNTEAGSTGYVVQFGDTLKSIAQATYGNASLWYVVAQANALGSDGDLVVGQSLTLPEVTTNANTADTFKPYDPAKIAGSTTPPSVYAPPPPPPSHHHCNALAQIVVVAVMVVVAYYAGPWASHLLGSEVLGGAVAGAAASTAGQLTGDALGVHQGFSLGEVAVGAAGGAIGGGLSSEFSSSTSSLSDAAAANGISWGGNAIVGAASYTGSYVVSKVVGQSTHFSWAGLVANAAGSAAAGEIGPTQAQGGAGALGGGSSYWGRVGANVVQDVVKRETSVILGDSHVQSWEQVGEDVFGNALGNAAVAGINAYEVRSNQRRMEQIATTENTLLTGERSRLDADMNDRAQASVNGDMEALGMQAGDMLGASVESGMDARLMAYAEGNLGSGAWARVAVPSTSSSSSFIGTWPGGPSLGSELSYTGGTQAAFDLAHSGQLGSTRALDKTMLNKVYDYFENDANAVTPEDAAYAPGMTGLRRLVPKVLEGLGSVYAGFSALWSSDNVVTEQGVNPFTHGSVMGMEAWNTRFDTVANLAVMGVGSLESVGMSSARMLEGEAAFGVANSEVRLGLQTLDPTKTSFTQSWVSYHKLGASYNFDTLVESMSTNGWVGKPVDVVRMLDGTLTSIDNTRILAARQAGIEIQANVRAFDDLILDANRTDSLSVRGVTPSTWGDAALLRINSPLQNDVLRNGGVMNWSQRFPNGSIYDPNIWMGH